MSYKIDDLVTCINNGPIMEHGSVYTELTMYKKYIVIEEGYSDSIRVLNDRGMKKGYFVDRFILFNIKELI